MAFDGLIPSVLSNRKKYGGFGMDIADISFINMSTAPIALCPSTYEFLFPGSVDLSYLGTFGKI